MQERVLREPLGRGRFALFQFHLDKGQLRILQEGRDGLGIVPGFLLISGSDICPPAGVRDRFPLGLELVSGALQRDGGLRIAAGVAHSADKAQGDQVQHRQLPGGQLRKVGGLQRFRGDDGMVVGHLLPVDDLSGVHGGGGVRGDITLFLHHLHQPRQHPRHVLREVAAVRPGVGDELLLIEALSVVQSLLRREAQLTVGVPLEGGQVVERRGLLRPVLAFHILHRCRPRRTAVLRDLLRLSLFLHTLSIRRKALRHKLDRVERLGLKAADRRLPVTDHRQRGRHDTAHIEGGAVLA